MKKLLFAGACAAIALGSAAHARPAHAPGYAVVKSIKWDDGRWDYVRADPQTRRIYVAHGDTVMEIDPAAGDRARDLGKVTHSHQALPLPNAQTLLVTDEDASAVRLLDAQTGEQRAQIPVGKKPDGAIWDSKRRLVHIVNGISGSISVLDPAAAKVLRTVQLKPRLEYEALDAGGRLYVANETDSTMTVVDVDHGQVVRTLRLPGCEGPTGVEYVSVANRIVTACDNGVALLIDPKTLKPAGKLPIGEGADAVLYDAQRGRVFVPAGDSGELSVFRATKAGLTPIGTVRTEVGVRTGAIDPQTGRIYLPTAKFQPGTTPDEHKFVPGTFHVLVVAPTGGSAAHRQVRGDQRRPVPTS